MSRWSPGHLVGYDGSSVVVLECWDSNGDNGYIVSFNSITYQSHYDLVELIGWEFTTDIFEELEAPESDLFEE